MGHMAVEQAAAKKAGSNPAVHTGSRLLEKASSPAAIAYERH